MSFTVLAPTGCGGTPVTHTLPVLNPLSDITLACATTASYVNFSGSGTPGATITVMSASGNTMTTAIVNASGSWMAQSYSLLPTGSYLFSVKSELADATMLVGNTQPMTIHAAKNCNNGNPHTAPTLSAQGNLTLSCGQSSTQVTLSGTATPGSTVTLKNASGAILGTAVTGTGGTWSIISSGSYGPGTYSFLATSTLADTTLMSNTTTLSVV
jgi:hypothetical protein